MRRGGGEGRRERKGGGRKEGEKEVEERGIM